MRPVTTSTPTTPRKRNAGATTHTTAPRAWQRMLSGRRLDLLDPSALDVEIEDIAHGLARVARWNGQTRGAHIFSVAQHALLVECIARQREPNLDRRLRLAVNRQELQAPETVIERREHLGDSIGAPDQRQRSPRFENAPRRVNPFPERRCGRHMRDPARRVRRDAMPHGIVEGRIHQHRIDAIRS